MHVLSSRAGVKFNCEKLSVLLLFQDTVHQTREFCKISWADAFSLEEDGSAHRKST